MSQHLFHFLSLPPPRAILSRHLLCPPCHLQHPPPHHHLQPPLQQQPFQLNKENKNNNKGNYNYYVFRGGGVSGKISLFNWGDHSSMAVDAVENGWSRFAFAGFALHLVEEVILEENQRLS